ncbi:hypothetical protein BDP27DRAFT_1445014 [Rhodocollybia butyracea]|uniref:Integrase core domain-containing protein n=1 Tax=Rhodocollybia butyracea TaxID=206335 RepID=A0A9P5UBR9_9AGAR|nr:hypothetical protein BDP27DRAFT_1445014 [Rhodocollybia butyracea]
MPNSEDEIASELLDSDQGYTTDPEEEAPSTSKKTNNNHNWKGINQYKNRPDYDDPNVHQALLEYHRRNITNKDTISQLLEAEHASVTRRKKYWGIQGSRVTTAAMPELNKRQLVFNEMAKDPNGKRGPRTVKEVIALETGVHLTREYIENIMREQDPDGFTNREPTSKKIHRTVLVCLGPHHEWSGDGHDKLSAIGFPIWGIRDVWSGKWLGLWVVPNNRLKDAIAYLFLKLVHEYGGIPVQMTTDCGSELVMVYGFANALREMFASDLPIEELPAHRFMQSIHNITIERGWLRLRLHWGDNVKIFWEAGAGIYNSANQTHHDLVQWLWPTLIQGELDNLRETFNNHRTRKDTQKFLPSGVASNIAFSLYEKYGGKNGLVPVDSQVIEKLMEEIGGEDLIRFVSVEYAAKARGILEDKLGPRN